MTRKEKVSGAMKRYLEGLGWTIDDTNCISCDCCLTNLDGMDKYCHECGEVNKQLIKKNKVSEDLWKAYLIGKKADK